MYEQARCLETRTRADGTRRRRYLMPNGCRFTTIETIVGQPTAPSTAPRPAGKPVPAPKRGWWEGGAA